MCVGGAFLLLHQFDIGVVDVLLEILGGVQYEM